MKIIPRDVQSNGSKCGNGYSAIGHRATEVGQRTPVDDTHGRGTITVRKSHERKMKKGLAQTLTGKLGLTSQVEDERSRPFPDALRAPAH